jgi:hypothetical protein
LRPATAGLPGPPALWYLAGRTWAKEHKGSGMHIDPAEGHPAMDYSEHQRTYKLFLKMTLYTIVSVVILMAILAIFVV